MKKNLRHGRLEGKTVLNRQLWLKNLNFKFQALYLLRK